MTVKEMMASGVSAVALLGTNAYQAVEVYQQDEAIERSEAQHTQALERWVVQLDAEKVRCDAREITLRDDCLGWIDRIRGISPPAAVVPALFVPSHCAVGADCPTWPCETDDQCLDCWCNEYGRCE